MKHELLMIPGPIEIHPEVMAEMIRPLEAHYGSSWAKYYNQVLARYKRLIDAENSDGFFHVGSGHAGIDAVVGSLVEAEDGILVLTNGFFGERIAHIVESYRAKVYRIEAPWGKAVTPDQLDEYLARHHEELKAVMMVHNETSTGSMNPVRELVGVARKYELTTFVDAVCSIGTTEFKMDSWGVDFVVTASQKGLGAPPGLTLINVGPKGWEAIEARKEKPVGWYLNLLTMRDFAQKYKDWQPYGITMVVNCIKALDTSLGHIFMEGAEQRIKRHEQVSQYFREELRKLGLETLSSEEDACNAVTVIRNPKNMSSSEIINWFKSRYGIQVAAGLGPSAQQLIRVGHMNLGASENSVVPVVNAFKELLKQGRV